MPYGKILVDQVESSTGKVLSTGQVASELNSIARSLNVADTAVIYSTDTTTVLDDVSYIYDATAQTTWGVPTLDSTGKTIVSVVGSALTTTGGAGGNSYTLTTINKSGIEFATITDIDNGDSIGGKVSLLIGDGVVARDYATGNDAGLLFFKAVAAGTGTDDGGKYIDLPTHGLQLEQNLKFPYSAKAWGAVGDGIVNDAPAIQSALNYTSTPFVELPEGNYRIEQALRVKKLTTLRGQAPALGFGRGVNITSDVLQDYFVVGSGYQVTTDNYLHGVRIEDITFRGDPGVTGQNGFLYSAAGDGSHISRCKFFDFDTCLDIRNLDGEVPSPSFSTSPQVSANVKQCSFYSSTTAVNLDGVGNLIQFETMMTDGVTNPLVMANCTQSLNCSIDGWHIENIPNATDLVYIDDCQGTLNVSNVDCGIGAAIDLFHIGPTQTANKFRLKVQAFRCTFSTGVNLLNDEVDNVVVPYSDLGNTSIGVSFSHNFADAWFGGLQLKGKSWQDKSLKYSDGSIVTTQANDSSGAHMIGQFGGSGFAGIQIVDAGNINSTYAMYRGSSTLSEWNLYSSSSPHEGGAPTPNNGGFVRFQGLDLNIGSRVGDTYLYADNAAEVAIEGITGTLRPTTDNTNSLGSASFRWSEVFSGTGTINTSDGRMKEQVKSVDDLILDAWESVNYCEYKFKDAVAEKGTNARTHFGVIAQDVKAAFEAVGLNAFDYGILCYDQWDDKFDDEYETVSVPVFDGKGVQLVNDDDVELFEDKQLKTGRKVKVLSSGDRYGVRYEEALCLEAALLRRKLKSL